MSFVVTVPAAASEKQLVDLDSLKSRLGITSSDDDEVLSGVIDEASQLIVDYLGTELAVQEYQETLPGSARTKILLSRFPVNSIDSVTHDGTAITDYSIWDARVGILYRESGWTRKSQSFSRLVFDPHVELSEADWVFTYTAGYTLPPGEEGDESSGVYGLPVSFRAHAIDLASWVFYKRRESVGANLKSWSIGGVDGQAEEYFASTESASVSGIPPSIEKQLDQWKQYV